MRTTRIAILAVALAMSAGVMALEAQPSLYELEPMAEVALVSEPVQLVAYEAVDYSLMTVVSLVGGPVTASHAINDGVPGDELIPVRPVNCVAGCAKGWLFGQTAAMVHEVGWRS